MEMKMEMELDHSADTAIKHDQQEDAPNHGNPDGVEPSTALEDMFSDSEDPTGAQSSISKHGNGIEMELSLADPDVMIAFYQRLFPWRFLFQWLNHATDKPMPDFYHREFAFSLRNDAYLRYQAFNNHQTLKKEILRLNPTRFEIGPVYSANPKDRKTLRKNAFKPIEKELVFDIDLTDYDDVRTCCSKTTICNKCWQFVTMAIKVIDVALRDDFGFKHIVWVYSGRRGAHAWVCDKRARKMDDMRRKSIATYLEVIKGGSQAGKKVNIPRPLHPHISRSLDILKDSFVTNILDAQDPWREQRQAEHLLQLLPDRQLNDSLRKKWESNSNRSSSNKWNDIDSLARSGISNTLQPKFLLEAKQDILIEYTYPRLDAEVSKHLNHLLKSPFCVHPGTGKVCVPIDISKVDEFDPERVPTVLQLLKEIGEWSSEHVERNDGQKLEDYDKTSLAPYVQFFKSFVDKILAEEEPSEKMNKAHTDAMEF